MYCGSSRDVAPVYWDAARATGKLLAARGLELVYGGAKIGLMGALADAALEAGGTVTGVMPERLRAYEIEHRGCTTLEIVPDMHTRKARMAELGDAFVALPGGLGTFEELFEMLTWTQLSIHDKPVGLLNANGYYDRLLDFLSHAADVGFIREEQRSILSHARTPDALLDVLAATPAGRFDVRRKVL